MNAPDRIERFLMHVREVEAFRSSPYPDYAGYERFKREFLRDFPMATPAEYERAMSQIAKATGV